MFKIINAFTFKPAAEASTEADALQKARELCESYNDFFVVVFCQEKILKQ